MRFFYVLFLFLNTNDFYNMIDFTSQITSFLRENFKPSTVSESKHQFSSTELLEMLFNVFPEGCIDDYELNSILTTLNYKPFKTTKSDKILIVWCLEEISN